MTLMNTAQVGKRIKESFFIKTIVKMYLNSKTKI